jgi:sigma-B regulation protein RsbU (phosphoserine phosphatase)
MVRNVIRAAALDHRTPAGVMAKTNAVVEQFTESDTFVTAFFASLDTRTGRLRYVGAGHPPVAIRRVTGATEMIPSTSPLIGAFSDFDYRDDAVVLEPGDTLFLYTDGLTEARSPGREFYGEERLVEVLSRFVDDLGPESVVDAVFNDVTLFAGSKPSDDMALVAIRLAR